MTDTLRTIADGIDKSKDTENSGVDEFIRIIELSKNGSSLAIAVAFAFTGDWQGDRFQDSHIDQLVNTVLDESNYEQDDDEGVVTISARRARKLYEALNRRLGLKNRSALVDAVAQDDWESRRLLDSDASLSSSEEKVLKGSAAPPTVIDR